ncbi:MAG: phosphoesterase [Betaproteobacteria bacterium HGW-Betaproteobacteria-11]|nr:MAG: phosphoesterase [Betaproteobacteria bacterium HGW-Betaproteobacteria-11]
MKSVLYDWGGLNLWLFHAINDLRSAWLDAFILFGSWLGDPDRFWLFLALALLFAWRGGVAHDGARGRAWRITLVVFVLGYGLDGLLVHGLKLWLDFPRPPLALPAASLHIVGEAVFRRSLPSGHAAFAMLVAASFWPRANRPVRLLLAGFALWVGLSRVSLGAHFPADVIAGWLLAFGVVRLLYRLVAPCCPRNG